MKFDTKELHKKIANLKNTSSSEADFQKEKVTLKDFISWLRHKSYLSADEYKNILNDIEAIHFVNKTEELPTKKIFKINPYKDQSLLKKKTKKLLISTFFIGFLSIVVIVWYLKGFSKQPSIKISNSSTQGGKVINYRGVLTDREAKPIDYKTDVTFKLYEQETSGEPVYIGQCQGERGIQPAYNGYFSVLIGLDCGMKEISENIFTHNKDIYLGITIGKAQELKPRQNISKLGFAINAEKLKGMTIGGGKSNVPFIDQTGRLLIDAVSPLLQSTSGNFTIEGQSITLQSSVGSAGSIIFNPDSGGNLLLANGNLGLGNTKPMSKLDIDGNASMSGTLSMRGDNSALNILNGSDFNISTSGLDETFLTSKFTLKSTGNVGIGDLNPSNLFSVSKIASESSIVSFKNLTTVDSKGNNVLDLHLGINTESLNSKFIQFFANSTVDEKGTQVGSISLNNSGVVYQTAGADFAEYFNVSGKNDVGDIIGINPQGVNKATDGNKLIGVVSNVAGFVGNINEQIDEKNRTLVGIVGQVQTNITNENGTIEMGDEIAIGSAKGYGVKAIKSGYIVGKALENINNISNEKCSEDIKNLLTNSGEQIKCGKIKILIQPMWFNSSLNITYKGNETLDKNNESRNMLNSNVTHNTNQKAGSDKIPAYKKDVIIYNSSITENSLIYLTNRSTNIRTLLSITEQNSCTINESSCKRYFKVSVDIPVKSETRFNWLIIN